MRSVKQSLSLAFVIAVVVPAPAAGALPRTPLAELREKHPCRVPIDTLLADWAPRPFWEEVVTSASGARAFRTQGEQLGTMIELTLHDDGEAEATRLTARTALTTSWNPIDCMARVSLDTYAASKPAHPAFTDEDLKAVLASHPKGVIYAWSPHMHLSLKALPGLRAAAAKLGLKIVPVLDPSAEPSFSRESAGKGGLAAKDLRRIESVELLGRGMTLHYPTLLVFSGGKLSRRMIAGFRDAAQLELLIGRELADLGAPR